MKSIPVFCLVAAVLFSGAATADAEAGQSLYASRGCIGCHGPGARSVLAPYPSLVGKNADYIRKSLIDFRSGVRKNQVMNQMAASLSDTDIGDLADYIGSLR